MRPSAAVPFAFLLAFSGCLSPHPHGSTGPPLASNPSPGPAWTLACPPRATLVRPEGVCVARVSSPLSAYTEPYLAVDPTDPQFAVLAVNEFPAQAVRADAPRPGTAPMRIRLFSSADGGGTWDDLPMPAVDLAPGQPVGNYSTADPALAFAPDGTLHVAGLVSNERLGFLEGNAQGVFHLESHDRGATWTAEVLDEGPAADRPWIAAGADGSLAVDWQNLGAAPEDDDKGVVRVRPAGGAWSAPVVLPQCVQASVPLVRDGAALLACRQTSFSGNDFRLRVAAVDVATAAATTLHLSGNGYFSFPRLVDLPGGTLVVLLPGAAGDAPGGPADLLLASLSADGGRTWSPRVDLVPLVPAAAGFAEPDLKWAEAGPDGRLHLVLGGGEQRRLTGDDPSAPTPRPYAYGALDLPSFAPAASQLLYDGLADWPADEPLRLAPLAYCCNDYTGLAFGAGGGLVAWSRDGAIDVAALRPPPGP
jgi:hypothetical protein